MTRTKAIKIVDKLVKRYGEKYVLIKFYDSYKYKLECRRSKDRDWDIPLDFFVRDSFSLNDLETLVKNTNIKLSDNIPFTTFCWLRDLGIQTIIGVIRQCQSNIEWFKWQKLVPLEYPDSMKEYEDFLKLIVKK